MAFDIGECSNCRTAKAILTYDGRALCRSAMKLTVTLERNSPEIANVKQHPARERVLRRLRVYLEQRHYPRLTLAAILALGGATGFLASAGLLALGLHSMAWRYGLAALLGYAVFLLGLRLWLSLIDRQRRNFDGVSAALTAFRIVWAASPRFTSVVVADSAVVGLGDRSIRYTASK